jgi:serine/threonine-protein kinase
MADLLVCPNGHHWVPSRDSPLAAGGAERVCPVCGDTGEVAAEDFLAALRDPEGEMPPPPRPVPGAVAQVALGLLGPPGDAAGTWLPTITGYEILGRLGRGGMGMVFRARDLLLGRLVALKVILADAEPKELARFRTEVEAVARLQHPNIVQIYEVGEEGGWAYCALEYVEGGSLARKLAGQPQPARPAAQLVETLARAVQFAHDHGIVHRDLKPGNILLQPNPELGSRNPPSPTRSVSDFEFRIPDFLPKITDFGLAKRLQGGAGQTDTGEILGTPGYMAPEQVRGKPQEVGPGADVYALGAILYELLTGRPPFQAATPLDTLLLVRSEEPVPPRRLLPSVPADVETVCLQCLNREPHRRYATAGALAEDLRRFLAGEPVLARPAGLWERAVKWARRRPAAAALLGVSGAAVLSLLALGLWHNTQLRRYNAELQAERDHAEEMRTLAQAKEVEAWKRKRQAEKQWQRAEANFLSAQDAVKQMLTRVANDEGMLTNEPRMELVRRKLMEDALQFYQKFLRQRSTDPAVRWEVAMAYLRVGDLRKMLGQAADAETAYRAAIDLYKGLADEFPQIPSSRFDLAGGYTNLGTLLLATGRLPEAEQLFRRALELQQPLADEFPAKAEYREDLAGSHHNLGTLMFQTGRVPEAEQGLRRALALRQRLAEEFPATALYRQDVARTQANLGNLFCGTDRLKEAEAAFRQSLDLQQRLVEEDPKMAAYRRELAGSHQRLAVVLARTGRHEEAEQEYARAVDLQRALAEDFPRVPAYGEELAQSYRNRGLLWVRARKPKEAERDFRQALDLQQRLVDEFRHMAPYRSDLAITLEDVAEVLLQQDRLAEARQHVEQAIEHQRAARKLQPEQPAYGRCLGSHYQALAETLLRLGDHTGAAQAAEEMPPLLPQHGEGNHAAARCLARCVPLAERDPALPREIGAALAQGYRDQALARLREALRHPSGPDWERVKTDPSFAPLRSGEDLQKLIGEWEEARRHVEK